MKQWVSGFRGVVVMILAWGAGWFLAGGLIELIENVAPGLLPFGSRVDMWPQELAIRGLLGGVAYTLLLAIAERHRAFHELSFARSATWGALVGLLLGGWAVYAGITTALLRGVWMAEVVVIAFTTAVSIGSALGSVLVFRIAARDKTTADVIARS